MEAPSNFVSLALVAFVPAAVAGFVLLGARRGMLAALMGGWLFLPVFDGRIETTLLHTKAMFVPAVVLATSLVLDSARWRRLRLGLVDVPMALVCLLPFVSSLLNELPWFAKETSPYKDAFSAIFEAAMVWGAPYLLGRLYLGEPDAGQDFAAALAIGGLAYVPVCLLELRLSPQLHRIVYGYHQHSFVQHIRGGSYRPMAFMAHGLMVGMFMAGATVAAYWLWRTRARRALAGLPSGWAFALLAATTLLCRSLGASVLLLAGIAALEGARLLRTSVVVVALLAIPPAYCVGRLSGSWTPEGAVRLTRALVSGQRAESLGIRAANEEILMQRALLKPWLGWGRWGGSRAWDEEGRDIVVSDGLWILTLGKSGLVGLIALWLALCSPAVMLLRLFPARRWGDRRLAPAAALAVVGLLHVVDDLFNAQVTPMAIAIPGALASLCLAASRERDRRVRAALAPAAPARVAMRSVQGHGA